jgi:predicted esterase YcpF (UPF0227 family)
MKRLYYFNGFNSAIPPDWSDNAKIVAVEAYAERHGYRFLPTTVDYRRATERVDEILGSLPATGGHVIFAGSSMGGWFARIVQLLSARRHPGPRVEALAFNPVFDIARYGHLLVGPQLNFVTREAYEWTDRNSLQLARLEASVDYDEPLPFYVYVDRGDEIISWELSAERHRPIARFRSYPGGSHRFEHAAAALKDYHSAPRIAELGGDSGAHWAGGKGNKLVG